MNTFEKHFRAFPAFLADILSGSPDFIVPVAKKGGKLLRLVDQDRRKLPTGLVRYKQYFVLNDVDLKGKRIAVLDDATQYTATLYEYRSFFERHGARVRTYSFVGHDGLLEGKHWKYDSDAVVGTYLSDPVYQEYIVQESRHLLTQGNHFDLDHIVVECDCSERELQDLKLALGQVGNLSELSDPRMPWRLHRFVVDDFRPFRSAPYLQHPSILQPPFRKIKFVYDRDRGKLALAPMIFPSWQFSGPALLPEHFSEVPFALPFALRPLVGEDDQRGLYRYYYSVYLVFAISLVKSFFQSTADVNLAPRCALRQGDLRATYGDEAVDRIVPSVQSFLCDPAVWAFELPPVTAEHRHRKRLSFPDAFSLISHLRGSYQEAIERRKTRVGVHYALAYDALVPSYEDRGNFGADLDYFCDLGVLVPDVIRSRGFLRRGVRSGEPDGQYDWHRTELLVPIAIDQIGQSSKRLAPSLEATALMKGIANFAFDYPGEDTELHNFVTEPYKFGAFVRVYHPLRAMSRPSLYDDDKVSPYYHYDSAKRLFESRHRQRLVKGIQRYFDEQLSTPYSEVAAYFRFLGRVAKHLKGTDVLNMLSICRDEGYFYGHLHFNLSLALEEAGRLSSAQTVQHARSVLREVDDQLGSAATKLQLFGVRSDYMQRIEDEFGSELEAIGPLTVLRKNWGTPAVSFDATMQQVRLLHDVQKLFAAVVRHALHRDAQAWAAINKAHKDGWFEQLDIPSPRDAAAEAFGEPGLVAFIDRTVGVMSHILTGMEHPQEGLTARLRAVSERRARNVATEYVRRIGAKQIVFLYIDLTGLRGLEEPRDVALGSFYRLIKKSAKSRGGTKLYGGDGGDDMFTIAFIDPESAIQCAKDIKTQFMGDLFLRAAGDVKFGLSIGTESPQLSESTIVTAWGRAKDACELKLPSFRNRGDLVVDRDTHTRLRGALRIPTSWEVIDGTGGAYQRMVWSSPIR